MSRKGDLEAVTKLYEANPSVINSKNEEDYSPLTLASYYSNKDIVAFLVDKVKTVDGTSKFGTPLMAAVVKGNLPIVELLLKHKANPNIKDVNGTTAGHYAVMFKKYDIVEQLLNAKADFNVKDNNNKSAMDYIRVHNDEKLNQLLNK